MTQSQLFGAIVSTIVICCLWPQTLIVLTVFGTFWLFWILCGLLTDGSDE